MRTIAVLAIACSACASVPSATNRCETKSLAEVFANPLAFFGKDFCGEALAVPEGRGLKIFPPGPVPQERNDVVMFLDNGAPSAIDVRSQPFSLYVEGTIDGRPDCFVREDITCHPFNRPFTLKVRRVVVR